LAEETLRTLELLFPKHDKHNRSYQLLNDDIKNLGLDPRLKACRPYQWYHNSPHDAMQQLDISTLSERFPHWAKRLYVLWLEADNPAPVSQAGWWSESKKSPRFNYWAGVIALSFAVLFGIVSTTLGALQVWISYCTWRGDGASRWCERNY
jgi:hypothetical protein